MLLMVFYDLLNVLPLSLFPFLSFPSIDMFSFYELCSSLFFFFLFPHLSFSLAAISPKIFTFYVRHPPFMI